MRYESPGAGGRTWLRTVVTANRLPDGAQVNGASWNVTVQGRLLVMDGMAWTIVKGTVGATDRPLRGPGLEVLSAERPQVKVLPNVGFDVPPHLKAWGTATSRVLSGPFIIRGKDIRRPGGMTQGRLHRLNSKRADWIALPYATSLLEIPWKIEAKRLPVRRAHADAK